MLGKIIGGIAGKRIARNVAGVDETGGAIAGVVAATVLRRFGLTGIAAAAVGAYAARKLSEKRRDSNLP